MKKVEIKSKITEYNSYYPQKNEMNSDAPYTPFHYLKRFNINSITRQNMIGVHKFLIYNDPSGDNIYVRSTSEIIYDMLNSDNYKGNPFSSIKIEKSYFKTGQF